MLRTRVITAVILAIIAALGIFALPVNGFALFITFIAAVATWEWSRLSGLTRLPSQLIYVLAMLAFIAILYCALVNNYISQFQVLTVGVFGWLLAFILVVNYPKTSGTLTSSWLRLLMGVWMILPLWAGLLTLKQQEHNNLLLFYVLLIVWVADIGAYFAGRRFGNKKLAPKVSPGKSWAGFYGGLGSVILLTIGALIFVDASIKPVTFDYAWQFMLMSIVASVFSVLGDLFESMLKRHVGFKDSSSLLPGHGGVLDRVDSTAAAVPVFSFLFLLFGWHLV